MAKVVWDRVGERLFQTGVDRGVLYPRDQIGVAWNGLTSVSEAPTGGEAKPLYIDGYKYMNKSTREEFEGSIEAFTYPTEFEQCEGTRQLGRGLSLGQQRRKSFGLSYRTKIGNDLSGLEHGYNLNLVYNALATPSTKNFVAVGDTTDPTIFSWSFSTKGIRVPGHLPVMHMTVNSTQTQSSLLIALEDILYGNDLVAPRMPLPSEVITLFAEWPDLLIVDNGDGTFTVDGPDSVISMLNSNTFQITSNSVVVNGNTYSVSSN